MNLFKFLQYYATTRPNGKALEINGKGRSFAELQGIISLLAFKLRDQGLKPGQFVAIYSANQELQWLLTLAGMHEQLVTCSNHAYEAMPESIKFDWHLTDKPLDYLPSKKTIQVDQQWFDGISKDVIDQITPIGFMDSDQQARIILSSGTTGDSKGLALSYQQLWERVMVRNVTAPVRGMEQTLMTISTTGGLTTAMRMLVTGEPLCLSSDPQEMGKLWRSGDLDALVASPGQLASIMKRVQQIPDFQGKIRMIYTGGSAISNKLVEAVEEKFQTKINSWYGSTELGLVAVSNSRLLKASQGCAHLISPFADVKITDEKGVLLPEGKMGQIRAKTNSMFGTYIGDKKLSTAVMKDGWFMSGDMGYMKGGALIVVGRESDLINIGGAKFNPIVLDEKVASYSGIQDAACVKITLSTGEDIMCAAVVAAESIDINQIQQSLAKELGPRSPRSIVRVSKILRNEMGKVKRLQMAKAIEEAIAKQAKS